MRATIETFEQFADASLAMMGHKLGKKDRTAFLEEVGRHVDALNVLGVGVAQAASCSVTSVYISCPRAVAPRLAPNPDQGKVGGGHEGPTTIARIPINTGGGGPIRTGGGSCFSIPGTGCYICYEYECS